MTTLHALFLGTLQGLTEFLPISSSGHLVLAEYFFGLSSNKESLLGFDIFLHAGSLLALLVCYREVWWSMLTSPHGPRKEKEQNLGFLLIASLPAVVAGLLFQDKVSTVFRTPMNVGIALAFTGIILIIGEQFRNPDDHPHFWKKLLHRHKEDRVTIPSVILIGFAQALALIPGLSRSGLTISAGRAAGLSRKQALDFSFLMATPIIAGASMLALLDWMHGEVVLPELSVTLIGIFSSFIVSMLAINFLRYYVIRTSFSWFSPYLFALSIAVISYSLFEST